MRKLKTIPCIDARDLNDEEAEDWLCDKEYSTHYQNSVVQLYQEDGHNNPFVEWFEKTYPDYHLDKSEVNYIAILST